MSEKIKIFDTTLRDGEQSPGFSMNRAEKLLLARQLEQLGVDVIEAGFPAASDDDLAAVAEIAQEIRGPEICALARCHSGDIDQALRAVAKAAKPRVHVFIATSDIHLLHKLKIEREQAIAKAVEAVEFCRRHCDRVDFSPEDAGRSDPDFLVEILTAVVEAGADTINIPDTVGYLTPVEFGDLIGFLREKVPDLKNRIISTHCHNDLGLAVANSLAGILRGARQVECTINGIGERAGNAALEEVVMALKTRPAFFQAHTDINSALLLQTSRLLTAITGKHVQPNKAIVGQNAFAHEAGIHQHGLLQNKSTYEIMCPADVGWQETNFVLGKHSGQSAVLARLKLLNLDLKHDNIASFMRRFKKLADRKKDIYDEDLLWLVQSSPAEKTEDQHYRLLNLAVESEIGRPSRARVTLAVGLETVNAEATGNGAVEAVYNAMIAATAFEGVLTGFVVDAISPEKDSIANANISWRVGDLHLRGRGTDTDTIKAAALAFVAVLNSWRQRRQTINHFAP